LRVITQTNPEWLTKQKKAERNKRWLHYQYENARLVAAVKKGMEKQEVLVVFSVSYTEKEEKCLASR